MPTLTNIGGSRFNNALDAARDFKKRRADAARQLKKDWEGWLYRNPPNIPLLVSNVFYLALCLTVLILTVLIMHEHADDFKRNALGNFRDPTIKNTSPDLAPKPCGIPTPDGMYLLQALGARAQAQRPLEPGRLAGRDRRGGRRRWRRGGDVFTARPPRRQPAHPNPSAMPETVALAPVRPTAAPAAPHTQRRPRRNFWRPQADSDTTRSHSLSLCAHSSLYVMCCL